MQKPSKQPTYRQHGYSRISYDCSEYPTAEHFPYCHSWHAISFKKFFFLNWERVRWPRAFNLLQGRFCTGRTQLHHAAASGRTRLHAKPSSGHYWTWSNVLRIVLHRGNNCIPTPAIENTDVIRNRLPVRQYIQRCQPNFTPGHHAAGRHIGRKFCYVNWRPRCFGDFLSVFPVCTDDFMNWIIAN